jgi:Cu+-exporting ATPase
MWLLATPVQFYVAARFYRSAWRGLLHRRLGMDFLVVLGTTVAYAASVFSALQAEGSASFFESSSLLITFVVLGKFLETLAKSKTTEALMKLMDLQPRTRAVCVTVAAVACINRLVFCSAFA